MILDEATRIRVVRALIGMSSKQFATRLGICAGTCTAWEKGRSTPQGTKRHALAELCQEHGIAFSPSGMPFPIADCMIFKTPQENQNAE
jgi:DNA-binding XRE family transcriptional regulator